MESRFMDTSNYLLLAMKLTRFVEAHSGTYGLCSGETDIAYIHWWSIFPCSLPGHEVHSHGCPVSPPSIFTPSIVQPEALSALSSHPALLPLGLAALVTFCLCEFHDARHRTHTSGIT